MSYKKKREQMSNTTDAI